MRFIMADIAETVNWARVAAHIGAGLCMGIGALGPSLGQGYVGGQACESISKNPESSKSIFNTMLIAMTFTETSSIYCLLIALLLLFAV